MVLRWVGILVRLVIRSLRVWFVPRIQARLLDVASQWGNTEAISNVGRLRPQGFPCNDNRIL